MGSGWTDGDRSSWDAPASGAGGDRSRPPRPGVVTVAMIGVLLLLTGGGYVGVTWSRVEDVCTQELERARAGEPPSAVEVDWSWRPVGIRCTWDDGSRTSLWWGMGDR